MEDKIIRLYESYGKITEITENNKKTGMYFFECDIEKILPQEEKIARANINLNYIIARGKKENNVGMFCFGLTTGENLGKNALEIVNKVNNAIQFGRFVIDNDDDVNWTITYDYATTDTAEIGNYLISCIRGVLMIVDLMKEKE